MRITSGSSISSISLSLEHPASKAKTTGSDSSCFVNIFYFIFIKIICYNVMFPVNRYVSSKSCSV